MRLKDKVAIITGSSRGIGRQTALKFAEEGANIVINYSSSEDKAEEVVQEIKQTPVAHAAKVEVDEVKEKEIQENIQENQ